LSETVSSAGSVKVRARSRAAAAVAPAHEQATILIVEDDVLVRVMAADELREQGYSVVEAASADEALSVLHSNVGVDLLMTDVRMPGSLDGAALARMVRAEYPAVKVIVASGDRPDAGLADRFDGFFAKPYDVARLVRHIHALLD
jgi:two-component system, response regulator PdtaR